jgi:hypothetical protein
MPHKLMLFTILPTPSWKFENKLNLGYNLMTSLTTMTVNLQKYKRIILTITLVTLVGHALFFGLYGNEIVNVVSLSLNTEQMRADLRRGQINGTDMIYEKQNNATTHLELEFFDATPTAKWYATAAMSNGTNATNTTSIKSYNSPTISIAGAIGGSINITNKVSTNIRVFNNSPAVNLRDIDKVRETFPQSQLVNSSEVQLHVMDSTEHKIRPWCPEPPPLLGKVAA